MRHKMTEPFFVQKGNIFAVPIVHYSLEMAHAVTSAFNHTAPDCVAVELPETLSSPLLRASSRLPDISVVIAESSKEGPLYFVAEPSEGTFKALKLALDAKIKPFCIDLDVEGYPEFKEAIPDPFSISRIGLEEYYKIFTKTINPRKTDLDRKRELTMARRLKELSLSFDKVFFVTGINHLQAILTDLDNLEFPIFEPAKRSNVRLVAPTENSCREIMAECGYLTSEFESQSSNEAIPDRQRMILDLYKEAGHAYQQELFAGYNLKNLMKYCRNLSILSGKLMPDLYQILTSAKGCVDHNFAYETFLIATDYPHLKNLDNLPEEDLTSLQVWKNSKMMRFHIKHPSRKEFSIRERKDTSNFRFQPPGSFSICSWPPEDLVIEEFGNYLQKKGVELDREEGGRTIPFTTSLEDGIDTKETIRHFFEKKIYVKVKAKPRGSVGSVVVIFDADSPEEGEFLENFPWKVTWLGEHEQESDMAFYAKPLGENVVGPGICRSTYGGFMMSYPPRRMFDVWSDPDYRDLRDKSEILLAAAIDYAIQPLIVYVAAKPPRSRLKNFATRFGKKVIYIPIGQISPQTLKKLRTFHVLDGHDRREIAGDYIDN